MGIFMGLYGIVMDYMDYYWIIWGYMGFFGIIWLYPLVNVYNNYRKAQFFMAKSTNVMLPIG